MVSLGISPSWLHTPSSPPPATLRGMPPTNREALFRNLLRAFVNSDGSPTTLTAEVVEDASTVERFILDRRPDGDYDLRLVLPGTTVII